jgi:hypothetical protein
VAARGSKLFPLKDNGAKKIEKYDRYKGRSTDIKIGRKERKENDERLTHKRNHSRLNSTYIFYQFMCNVETSVHVNLKTVAGNC